MLFDFLKKYSDIFDTASHKEAPYPASSSSSQDEVNHKKFPNGKGNDKMIRKHLVFRGSVQGVGFRYTSYHLAESLGLTGWVRNEYDGSVSCEVQGPEYMIQEFLQKLNSHRWIYIESMDSDTLDVDSDESSFEIKY